MEDPGIALKMPRSCVGCLYSPLLCLVDMEMQPYGILEAADEAHLRIRLFDPIHEGIVSKAEKQYKIVHVRARVACLQQIPKCLKERIGIVSGQVAADFHAQLARAPL